MTERTWRPAPKPTDYRFEDLTGRTYGRLTIIGYAGRRARNAHVWEAACMCGKTSFPGSAALKSGRTKSCGCYRSEATRAAKFKHGATEGNLHSPEYRSWTSMRNRCYWPKSNRYSIYGGRGITVCDRWRDSFENFFADMGPKPSSKHSIDRIDTNGHYEPTNCRWATFKEQARNKSNNRRVVYAGRDMTLRDLADDCGVSFAALKHRLDRGSTVDAAVSALIRKRRARSISPQPQGTPL